MQQLLWNVLYHSNEADRPVLERREGWPHALALLEDVYTFEDALLVGCVLNSFIRRSDVVKVACLAQLVNVIAPIMTVPGGPVWRQTTYFPFLLASRYGRGTALRLSVFCGGYSTEFASEIPYLDIAGVQADDGSLAFFMINRHLAEAMEVQISLQGFAVSAVIEDQVMAGHDSRAVNGPNSESVVPRSGTGARVDDGLLCVTLEPLSYRMIRVGVPFIQTNLS
jgi:alpha-N-arabinofuranosidase